MKRSDLYDHYLELNFTDFIPEFPLDRRDFLKLTGGGIFLFFTIGQPTAEAVQQRQRFRSSLPSDFNAFLRIAEDGTVTCFTGKIEMGQGIITSLAQMLADELEVPLERVKMVMGDTDLCPWDMGTFGSMSTRFFGPPLRAAGAAARQVLLEMAAEMWRVPVSELTVNQGEIVHRSDASKRVTYGELAKGKRIARQLSGKATVKKPEDFRIMGKPVNRRDARLKVTGEAKYAGDIRLPGMLYARILRPPAHGATLKTVDTSAAENVAGVRVVKEGDLIAVLHELPDVAEKALALVRADFDVPPATVTDKTIFDHLLKVAPEGQEVSTTGDLNKGKTLASETVEHTYLDGYVAHAPIEPHTATVQIKDGKVTVWASTQTPFRAKDEVAEALNLPADSVRVIPPFVGGGFGGKTANRQVVEAARLAQLTGRPVQVAWTRAEEFFYDTFRPAAVVKINAGIDKTKRIVLWDYHVYFAGTRGSEHFYDVPHSSTVAHGGSWRGGPGTHPFATGAWRAPSNNTNTFARESHIDILAARAKVDPVTFRLNNLKDPRMRRVLQEAAKHFGGSFAPPPSGKGIGVACGIDAGTYVATIVEVAADARTGHVQVKRVVAVQDMGICINPEGAKIQMEGCITMGLGYALTEDIHFEGGKIFEQNFDTYEIPRFSMLPKIEVYVVENNELDPQGGGEPAIITMGGAIANAIYDAIGVRVFQLPMTPERILAAKG